MGRNANGALEDVEGIAFSEALQSDARVESRGIKNDLGWSRDAANRKIFGLIFSRELGVH